MKRFLIIFLCIIIIFVSPQTTYAGSPYPGSSDYNSELDNYNDWSFTDKARYMWHHFSEYCALILGIASNGIDRDTWQIAYDITADDVIKHDYANFSEFIAAHSSYKKQGEDINNPDPHFVFDDTAMSVLNDIKIYFEQEAEYVLMYPLYYENIPASSFTVRDTYTQIQSIIRHNPDMLFSLYLDNVRGTIYLCALDIDTVYAVSSSLDPASMMSSINLYDSDWHIVNDTYYGSKCYYISWSCRNNHTYECALWQDNSGVVHEASIDDEFSLLFDIKNNVRPGYRIYNGSWGNWGPITNYYKDFKVYTNPNATSIMSPQLVSSRAGGIPVFNSETAMRKGTSDCKGITPAGDYFWGTPITNNVCPIQDVDITIPPGSSGGDGGGGSGSGSDDGSGNGFLSTFISALKGLGDAILGILSVILNFFAGFIELITKPLTDLANIFSNVTSLIPSGFVDFLSALFPFIPEEWVTMCGAFLAVALFGSILAFFLKR